MIARVLPFALFLAVGSSTLATAEEKPLSCEQAFYISVGAISGLGITERINHPNLPISLEQDMFAKLRKARANKDKEEEDYAATVLVGLNQRLFYSIAKRVYVRGLKPTERLDEINLKLFTMFSRFDPDEGVRFSSWAVVVAERHLCRLHYYAKHKESPESREVSVSQLYRYGDEVDDKADRKANALFRVDDSQLEKALKKEEKLFSDLTISQIQEAFQNPEEFNLTRNQALVLSLRFPLDGSEPHHVKEIAGRDDIEAGTTERIYQLQRRGLQNIREALSP